MTYKKIDDNHKEIVNALISVGASVQSLAATGKGVPDLLVGFKGENFLLEVKDGRKPPYQRKLTNAQQSWHGKWCGSVSIVNNSDEAIEIIRHVI